MSVSKFYEERFGMTNNTAGNVGMTLDHIEQVHFNVAGLLDLSLEIDGASNLDYDHLFSAVRGAVAMLALVEPDIAFLRKALREADREEAPSPAPTGHEGGLSGVVDRMRGGGLSATMPDWRSGGLGAYWTSKQAGVA